MGHDDEKEGGSTKSPPQKWVEPYLENEKGIKEFLDTLIELKQYDSKEARKRLRNFASDIKKRQALVAVYFSLFDQEDFFADVEDDMGEEIEEKLRQLGQDYATLKSEIGAVYGEEFYKLWNPLGSFESRISNITYNGDPLISLTGYSGDTPVLSTTAYPSSLLNNSASILNNVTRTLENREDSPTVTEQELEDIIEERDHIQRHLEELNDLINDLEEENRDE